MPPNTSYQWKRDYERWRRVLFRGTKWPALVLFIPVLLNSCWNAVVYGRWLVCSTYFTNSGRDMDNGTNGTLKDLFAHTHGAGARRIGKLISSGGPGLAGVRWTKSMNTSISILAAHLHVVFLYSVVQYSRSIHSTLSDQVPSGMSSVLFSVHDLCRDWILWGPTYWHIDISYMAVYQLNLWI
jgi:hypothetical protein